MDLQNPKWMYLKAGMLVLTGILCFMLVLLDQPSLRTAALLLVMIWAFARAYYFAFYVVEKYADPEYRFSGLMSFCRYLMRKHGSGRDILALLGWIVLTFSASATSVFVTTSGWYAGLVKPSWNPPGWLFGPVWTLIYAMMAVAAWLVWREGGRKAQKPALGLYLVQWALNALWTPLFFGMHRPGLAFAEILVLDLAVLATLIVFWRVRRAAGLLLVLYGLWVTFATVLNFTIWRLNI